MDSSIGLSPTKSGKTKDDFIHQAHEARQARELARRREQAATTIQAFLKAAHIRKKLKEDACRELEGILKLPAFPTNKNLLSLLRKLMFVCDPDRDRNTLDLLFLFILTTSNTEKTKTSSSIGKDTLPPADDVIKESLIEDAIRESLELSSDHNKSKDDTISSCSIEPPCEYVDFVSLILTDILNNRASNGHWLYILEKILNLCLDYLSDANSTRLDSQHIDTYLQIITLFISVTPLYGLNQTDKSKILAKLSHDLFNRTLNKRKNFFKKITNLICEKINRFRNDLKTSILTNYTHILLRLLDLKEELPSYYIEKLSHSRKKEMIDIVAQMLSIPGIIYNLEKHATEALKELNDCSIFTISLRLLSSEQEFQKLTSTSSVCLLANLIHLASMNEAALVSDTILFADLSTKLLESCQKNMLQVSTNGTTGLPKISANQASKKKNESRDVSFNPILGWLAREQVTNVDKDMIKSQLSHLWSLRFLKILLIDLVNANEKSTATNQSSSTKPHTSNLTPKIKSYTKVSHECQTASDSLNNSTTSMPISLFKRVVERATSTMTKTINNSYAKTTGTSSNSGAAKLLTPEANRIALVCNMLHTSLKTLSTLKQDILAGLCLHDYLLVNLWTFISSLGPHNGLKAFLEHLTIYTKTSSPEFYILTLFCECASHLISILDDSELYEKQQPFRLEELVAISAFLNNFVFRVICNNLIPYNAHDMDPILQTTHNLLTDLYKRDCRRKFAPQDHWLIKDIKMSVFSRDLESGKPTAKTIMTMLPHIIPHKERVLIFRKLVQKDKAQFNYGPSTLITIHRSRIVEDGYQQLVRLPPNALKGLIRVKFINDYGLDEAGIDQDGVFKEFLEDTIKRVFDPALNLFCSTSEQRLYPSPTSRLHEDYLSLFKFVGKMLGKAIYEGIVVDVPFATFFLSRVLGQPQSPLYSPIDELPSLDPELYKSLTYIKHYEGDVSELDLTFSIDQDFMGKIETHELEPGGKSIPVTRETRVRYIHSVANFRMKTQIEKQTEAFVSGFKSIINLEWLSMFSASEFQRLISGDNTPIDLQDLRRHTKYFGGFHNNHRVVCWLWDILEKDFTSNEHSLFLKFVTSCSKPPLLGFANLEPPFTIRCVEVSDDQDLGDTVGSVLRGFFAIRRSDPVDRLPTSSTCFNLLKLPNYQRRSTLREKLRYAILSNPGFELS